MEKTRIGVFDLIPTDGHKSFYGKAKVVVIGKKAYLKSYDTIVMGKDLETGELFRTWEGWTATTGRHIKSFAGINKNGFINLPWTVVEYEHLHFLQLVC